MSTSKIFNNMIYIYLINFFLQLNANSNGIGTVDTLDRAFFYCC